MNQTHRKQELDLVKLIDLEAYFPELSEFQLLFQERSQSFLQEIYKTTISSENISANSNSQAQTMTLADLLKIDLSKCGATVDPFDKLKIGVSCLLMYTQANFIGPTIKLTESQAASPIEKHFAADEITKQMHSILSVDGELYHPKTFFSHHLLFSLLILNSLSNQFISANWWLCRCVRVHSTNLHGKSATLFQIFETANEALFKEIKQSAADDDEIQIMLRLETGIILNEHWICEKAYELFEEAKKISGLSMELTGKLGVRTKFQEHQISLLFLEAHSRITPAETTKEKQLPKHVENDDDLLLDKPRYQEAITYTPLQVYDQAIILSEYAKVQSTNPRHQLTSEELMAHVARVEETPSSWLIAAVALLLHARLENMKSRTHLRAATQVESLYNDFWTTETPSFAHRLPWAFSIQLPIHWQVSKELGFMRLSIGEFASALDIFEKLELWEEIVDCYRVLNRPKKAEDLINERLKIDPSPHLYCCLGDVTENLNHYHKAWEMSGEKFPRAQRSLAVYYLHQKDYEKAVPHFEKALKINPLYGDHWFSLGSCYIQLKQWKRAAESFTNAVRYMPDSGESWANLGIAHLQEGRSKEAFGALNEAVKFKEKNFHIWDNILSVAMEIGEFQRAMYAARQVLDFSPEKKVDVRVLNAMAHAVTTNMPDINEVGAGKYRQRFEDLLQYVEARMSDPVGWRVFSDYFLHFEDLDRAIDYREKEYRALQKPQWWEDSGLFNSICVCTKKLCEMYLKKGDSPSLLAGELKLDAVLKKSRDTFGSTQEFKELEELAKKFVPDTNQNDTTVSQGVSGGDLFFY